MRTAITVVLLGLLLVMPLAASGKSEAAKEAAVEDITLKVWIPTPGGARSVNPRSCRCKSREKGKKGSKKGVRVEFR